MGEMVQGLKSINWWHEIDRENVKNGIGNGVAKEHICMTHGHELRGKSAGENGGTGPGVKREKWGQL